MPTSDVLVIDHPRPGVRRLTLNRPEKRNALSNELRARCSPRWRRTPTRA